MADARAPDVPPFDVPPFAIPPGLEGLLPRFLAEMRADFRTLEALAAGGRAPLAAQAHAMRGKCALFGAAELAGLLSRLETRAPTAEGAEVARLVAAAAACARRLGAGAP